MSPAQPAEGSLSGMGELPVQTAVSVPGDSERPFSMYLYVPYC